MRLKGSRLSVLAVGDVGPPSSLELHWCKGIWEEKRCSECVVQVSSTSCMPCNGARMVLPLPPKHSLIFSCSGKRREEIDFLSSEFSLELLGMHRKSVRDPSRDHIPVPQSLFQLPCPKPRQGCLSTELSPVRCTWQWACGMLRGSMKNWRDHDCKQLWTPRARLLFYKASLSLCATLTALERLQRAGWVAYGQGGCIGLGRAVPGLTGPDGFLPDLSLPAC